MYESIFDKLKDGPLKISILGCGNWASAISRIVGENAKNNYLFMDEVDMWVKEEIVDGEKLSDEINKKHENVKYLKGISLPDNIIANPDITKVINGADLLIFVIPCQFLLNFLNSIKENKNIKIEKHVKAISLIKGFYFNNHQISFCSELINNTLNIDCSSLSGANIAMNVAMESFSEATIGSNNNDSLIIWKMLFDISYFKINCVSDVIGIEICGALKNIVALSVGFCEALNYSSNTKSAIIRLGVNEIRLFAKKIHKNFDDNLLFESCGYADIITSFLEGRNTKCSREFIKRESKVTWEQLEKELIGGQKLQGTFTLQCVYDVIKTKNIIDEFPLFNILYKISFENENPNKLIEIFMKN